MKKLMLIFLLSGLSLSYAQTFSSKSGESIESFTTEMKAKMGAPEFKELQNALSYYGFGGLAGMMALSKLDESEQEAAFFKNLSKLDGMTADQIIEKHQKEAAKPSLPSVSADENKDSKNQHDWKRYVENIDIIELSSKRIDTFTHKGIPAIRVGLKNNGDKSITYLKATIFFKDKDGLAIYEKDITPINTEAISFERDTSKPLRPNYIYELPTDKYITIDAPLSQWDEGEIDFEIVEIKFSEDK